MQQDLNTATEGVSLKKHYKPSRNHTSQAASAIAVVTREQLTYDLNHCTSEAFLDPLAEMPVYQRKSKHRQRQRRRTHSCDNPNLIPIRSQGDGELYSVITLSQQGNPNSNQIKAHDNSVNVSGAHNTNVDDNANVSQSSLSRYTQILPLQQKTSRKQKQKKKKKKNQNQALDQQTQESGQTSSALPPSHQDAAPGPSCSTPNIPQSKEENPNQPHGQACPSSDAAKPKGRKSKKKIMRTSKRATSMSFGELRELHPDIPRHPDAVIYLGEGPKDVPVPMPEYIAQAHLGPIPTTAKQNLLVILDLNGTLLYRPKASKKPTNFTARPWAEEFVRYCVDNFTTVVWSSAQPRNVRVMCEKLLPADVREKIVAIWDRDRFNLPPDSYNRRVQCYKRLNTVWSDQTIVGAHPDAALCARWDQTNTVLIDDSPEKAKSEPFNHIEIPSFVPSLRESDILHQVHEYLGELSYQADVSRYIRSSPFRPQA